MVFLLLISTLTLLQALLFRGLGLASASLWVFTAGLTLLYVIDLIRSRDWLQPRILFASFLWIYSVPLPLATLLEGPVAAALTVEALAHSSILLSIVQVALYLADCMPLDRDLHAWLHRHALSDGMLRSLFKISVSLAAPVWLVALFLLWRLGLSHMTGGELRAALEASGIRWADSLLSATLILLVFVGLLTGPAWLRGEPRSSFRFRAVCLGAYFMVVTLAPLIILDRRRSLAIAAIGIIITWQCVSRQWRRSTLLLAGLSLLLCMTGVHLLRATDSLDLIDMVHPARHGEMRIVHSSLHAVNQHLDSHAPLWGVTYLNSYRMILPRVIVDRPEVTPGSVPQDFIHIDPALWYSAQMDFSRALVGHHFGFSSLAEAHLNLPYLGPPLLLFVFVYLLRMVYASRDAGAFFCGLYVVLAANIFWYIRGPLPYAAKDLIMFLAVPMCFAILVMHVLPRRLKRAEPPRSIPARP